MAPQSISCWRYSLKQVVRFRPIEIWCVGAVIIDLSCNRRFDRIDVVVPPQFKHQVPNVGGARNSSSKGVNNLIQPTRPEGVMDQEVIKQFGPDPGDRAFLRSSGRTIAPTAEFWRGHAS